MKIFNNQYSIIKGINTMPGRYIREGILTSEKVDALSESAEVFYRRLLNVVDDHGRYYASVLQLFCNCYPLKEQLLNEPAQKHYFEKISDSLKECVEAKLVFLYCEKKYLQLVNFNQGKRSKSKFPEPRLTNVKQLQNECKTSAKQLQNECKTSAKQLQNECKTSAKQVLNLNVNDNDNDNEVIVREREREFKENKKNSEKKKEKKLDILKIEKSVKNSEEKSIENWTEEIYREFPKKTEELKSKIAVKQAIGQISESTGKTMADASKFLLDRVRQYSKSKLSKNRRFSKKPVNWFADGNYNDDPAEWEIDYNQKLGGKNGKSGKNKFDPKNYDPLAKGKGGFFKLNRNRQPESSETLPGLRTDAGSCKNSSG